MDGAQHDAYNAQVAQALRTIAADHEARRKGKKSVQGDCCKEAT